jgi:putative drug exporter of the RND superfamily
MAFESLRLVVSRRPLTVAGLWLIFAVSIGLASPSLTRLAAEGQSAVMGREVESRHAAALIDEAWPNQSYQSLAVAAFYRPEGLTTADLAFAKRVAKAYEGPGRPSNILRVLGPNSAPEIAKRLISRDGTAAVLAVPLDRSFVSPMAQSAVNWLQRQVIRAELEQPAGLQVRWTGDAVLGRDYMKGVQTSLDRAAIATVFLLLIVLMVVYRSVWLSLIPLVTIGMSLLIARGLLAWLHQAGWETSPLVELFLVAVLFGSGTDFCLFLSWRFAENWDPEDAPGAMRKTLANSSRALLTTAGTVIIGLLLMGTTKFKLFSTTGPSVALGLVITLLGTLTLTPALLVLLARYRPASFKGITAPSSGRWERVGALAMSRPLLSWSAALLLMAPLAVLGTRTHLVQDLMSELPGSNNSTAAFRLLADKFGPGMLAPLTVVLESEQDLRNSEGLALIDDVSRFLSRQRGLSEVRSATQPLGSPAMLSRARLNSRLNEVNSGFGLIEDGASKLHKALGEGAVKLRTALWLEEKTGLSILGATTSTPAAAPAQPPANVDPDPDTHPAAYPLPSPTAMRQEAIATGLRRATALLHTGIAGPWAGPDAPAHAASAASHPAHSSEDPRLRLIEELLRASDGAGQIADGAARARSEMGAILTDPVGRRALDRLLINAQTVKDNPDLDRGLSAYITPDGHRARIDLSPAHRVFSAGAMDQVVTLRRRLSEFLADATGPKVVASIAGSNAESADVRALTRADQVQSWFVIPIGVLVVLLVALRDPITCLNLVATMLLTYVFALGATHLFFVVGMGAEGLDWKVPYFLFVLLVAVGVDYNVFLMARLQEETRVCGLRQGIVRAIGQTGGLITSAAAITACSFSSFMSSPLLSLRQLGFALVVGITVDALLVRPLLVPCGHWLLSRLRAKILCPTQSEAIEFDAGVA